MISETYIYGEINKAIFKKNEKYFVLERSSEGKFYTFPLSNFELNDFYLSNPEASVVKNINWDENKVQEELNKDIQKKEALNFFLMGMDTSLSNEIRKEAMELLAGDEFKNSGTQSFLKNRIFATKIPESFDPLSSCEIASTTQNEQLVKLYKNLSEARDIIIIVRNVWKKIILEGTFINPRLDLEQLDKEFTDRGIFSDFVMDILTKNYKDIDNSIVKHSDVLKKLNISGQPGVLLNRIKQLVFQQLSIIDEKINEKYFDDIKDDDKKYEISKEDDFESKFNKLIKKFKGKSQRRKERQKGLRLKIPILSKYFNVDINKQVFWIKKKILLGNTKEAEKGILKLIEFQDVYSEKEHLCKSLCDIAESFQKVNYIDTANYIAQIASGLNPNDAVPLSILAENLKAEGKINEAFEFYNHIIKSFENSSVTRNGRAETLRQMGRLEEALKAYEENIRDFKNEVVSRSGRAETLRQMGKLDEALKAYDEIINVFKNDVIPRCGRAETLRQMGRLDEALNGYDEIISDFKNDRIPRNGRAETLRQMGRLEEALKSYDDLIKSFPYDQIAKTARIVLLIQMGTNLNEVERELTTSIPESQRDWILNHVYCMLLIKQNKLDEAIIKLKNGVDKVQDSIKRHYYTTALSYAYIRKKQYDKAILNLKSEPSFFPLPKILVTHAYAADGNLMESKKYFSEIFNSQIKKVDETARYLSDRYQIHNQKYFLIQNTSDLDEKIETLEFDLITESYYFIAA